MSIYIREHRLECRARRASPRLAAHLAAIHSTSAPTDSRNILSALASSPFTYAVRVERTFRRTNLFAGQTRVKNNQFQSCFARGVADASSARSETAGETAKARLATGNSIQSNDQVQRTAREGQGINILNAGKSIIIFAFRMQFESNEKRARRFRTGERSSTGMRLIIGGTHSDANAKWEFHRSPFALRRPAFVAHTFDNNSTVPLRLPFIISHSRHQHFSFFHVRSFRLSCE